MPIEIVGRDEEVASVRAFVEGAAGGCAALVLEGDAGVGKSTLWLAGVEHARAEGLRTLVSRPAEAERDLAHVALGDLLESILDDALPVLPPPRRRALEVALLRGDRADETVDGRALAVATLTALQLLARDEPVLLAIDDVQWLDDSSARVLAFALRRLREANLLLLLTRRVGEGSFTADVDRALGLDRVQNVRLGPLSIGALQRLLHTRLGRAIPRPLLIRLHESSGGNPFYALELARMLPAHPILDPTEPLPVPESLEAVARDRLAGLPPPTRAALAVIAAGGRPRLELLGAAAVPDEALAPAFAARVLETRGRVVTFTHPLLGSALYGNLTRQEREHAHELLAKVVDDPIARARHLALATRRPQEEVAAAVEEAAGVAAGQSANVAAAELAAHALRLTPSEDEDAQHRRAVVAVRLHLLAGDASRARAEAEQLLVRELAPRQRADVLIALSDVENTSAAKRAIAFRREALAAVDSDPALQASIHTWLAGAVRVVEGLDAAEAHARAALGLAERVGDDGLRAGALAALSVLRFNAGAPEAPSMADQAVEFAATTGSPERLVHASFALAHVLTWSAQLDRARVLLERLHAELSLHDEVGTSQALWYLSLVELDAGRLAPAAEHADRQREISRLYATDDREDPLALWVVARIAAHRGELERAHTLAEHARSLAAGRANVVAGQEAVLGLVSAWKGQPADAVEHFSVAEEARYESGIRSPSMYWWRAEQVEALLELGRSDEAVGLLDVWAADATRLGLDWVLAQATRCRGLVAAAGGEVRDGVALLEEAVARHENAGDPFGRARALLALGVLRRRGRQKRAAREAIEASVEVFEAIGAAGWAAKARSELGHIGGRVREPGLTAAERRVATLVAEGRTNREVAAELFLGERTVETHLSHVYAKLGVRSRSELARTYRPDEQSSGGLTISS
jgi:DNA-binding CsgD family transcriptional regulator